jgi:hypothetical protein
MAVFNSNGLGISDGRFVGVVMDVSANINKQSGPMLTERVKGTIKVAFQAVLRSGEHIEALLKPCSQNEIYCLRKSRI